MFSQSAQLYDLIYSSFKDYPAEAAFIADCLRCERPACRAVLDVACGTGEHARLLAEEHGFEVDGVDVEPGFIEIASGKNPGGRFRVADMADFSLSQRYDAVICLFSSIGYLKTLERVTAALRCFTAHLEKDGIVLVEPWFPPGAMEHGRTATVDADNGVVQVERTARVEVAGRLSRVHFYYRIKDADGARDLYEVHELGLFTVDEMLDAFRQAGLSVTYDEEGPTGRGLYMGRHAVPGSTTG